MGVASCKHLTTIKSAGNNHIIGAQINPVIVTDAWNNWRWNVQIKMIKYTVKNKLVTGFFGLDPSEGYAKTQLERFTS